MRLGEIATVRSGLVLSRKLSREPTEYPYPLLNLRAVAERGYIDDKQLDNYYAIDRLDADYLTQEDDIIIRLSTPYTAVLIDNSTIGMVISSNFAIIRSDKERLLPGYLRWLLNTPKVKRQIYENTSSNMLGAIKPKFFADFEIEILPLNQQQQIAMLNRLARSECKLLMELAEEKERYYALVADDVQRNMRKGNSDDNQK